MFIHTTTSLRRVLAFDAAMSGLAAIAFAAGAGIIAFLTELPHGLVFWSGIVLVPWTVFLGWYARREQMPRIVLVDIVAVNALWTAASFGLLLSGVIQPNALGVALVVAQAIMVGVLTALQFAALRGGRAARAA